MTDTIIKWVANKLTNQPKKHFGTHFFIIFFFLLPLIIIATFSIVNNYKYLTDFSLERRESIADLTATTVHANLSNVVAIGDSLATRVQLRKNIALGAWDDALEIIKTIPTQFPSIERVALIDLEGVMKASAPYYPGLVGQNFSERDWYKGVTKNWQPYVSEVFKSATNQNSIVISTPIISDAGEKLGILGLQILTNTILDWSEKIKIGKNGFVYIFDQHGRIVAHPKFEVQGAIADFSTVSVVQKSLQGTKGMEVTYNPIEKEERVSAYSPVLGYGWGVVVQEPTESAFADRNREIMKLAILYAMMLLFGLLLGYLFLKLLHTINDYRQKEEILLNSIGEGAIAIDRFWNITLWNKSAEKISGWSKEEALGKPLRNFLKLLRERDRTENIAFIEEAIVYGRTGFLENNTILIAKDGSEVPVGDSAAPIFDSAGIVVGAIIIFRNISKEKENSMIKSDVAYASHQFNTPITKTLWLLESAKEEKSLTKTKEKIEIAYTAALSLQKLSSELLAVSEIDQKIIIPKVEDVKLTDLFDKILKDVEKNIKMSNKVKLEIKPISAILGIKTDQKLFKGAMFEIIDNAIKYNKPLGKVSVQADIQDGNMLVTVSDTGIGIPTDQQSIVFTKFFRGNNVDTTEIIGAGLGLFIAREYIKLLHGKIWFKSEAEKGTTFFVQIPLK